MRDFLAGFAGLLPDCRLGCLGEPRHAGYSRPVGSVMAGMIGVGEVARLDELAKLIDRVGAVLLSALADVYLHRSQAKSRGFAVKRRQLSLLRGRRIGGYWDGGGIDGSKQLALFCLL